MEGGMATEEERSKADPVYKTKVVEFLGRSTPIVLQNENGPCPLLAICNVLLLRNVINLSVDESEVNQQRLLSLVAERLIDSNSNIQGKDELYVNNQQQNISDAIDLLPQLAKGLDVNMHFGKINDFEFTRECAIFDLLDIALYHGWIVDPQDTETASVIGSKSYNTLVADLVNNLSSSSSSSTQSKSIPLTKSTDHQEVQESQPVDFAAATTAALGVPCPSLSRGLSFEERNKRRGDLEEEEELTRILDLSNDEVAKEGHDVIADVSDEVMKEGIGRVESSGDIFEVKFGNGERNEGIRSLDVSQFVKEKTGDDEDLFEKVGEEEDLVEKSGEEMIIEEKSGEEKIIEEKIGEEKIIEEKSEEKKIIEEKTGEEKLIVERTGEVQFVDEEPIYQGEEHIIMNNYTNNNNHEENLVYESSPEPVYEGEVVLAEQFNDNNTSNDDHKWQLIKNFLESNASQLTIFGLFCLQDGLKERELCVFFRNNHFSTMFKYNGELYLLATDQGYIHQPDLVWEKLNEVNGDTVFMTGNFNQFHAENRGNESSWNQQQAMTNTADYLAAIGGSDPSVSVTNPDLQLAIALQQQEFDQQQQQNRESQNRQQQNRQSQQNRESQQQNRESQQQNRQQQQPYPTPPPGSGRSRLFVGPQTQQRPAQNQPQRPSETKKEKCTIM